MIPQLVVSGLALGSIYALVALGVGLLFGILRLINFAHGDFITIGSYALIVPSADVTARLLIGGWPWPVMIPLICLIVVIAALLTDVLVFRPLRRASSPTLMIASFAVSYIIQNGVLMAYGSRVVIVPGYGMAVAQAQGPVRELMDLLLSRGVDVQFAIHPVAGRMPGHMNVLLAEANVPYDRLQEMDEINDDFAETDVALVIGANDVVNPLAREEGSPISGMPILNVDQAQNIIVLKRGRGTGFAGIPNPLFSNDKTTMLFGDAKPSVEGLVAGVKQA